MGRARCLVSLLGGNGLWGAVVVISDGDPARAPGQEASVRDASVDAKGAPRLCKGMWWANLSPGDPAQLREASGTTIVRTFFGRAPLMTSPHIKALRSPCTLDGRIPRSILLRLTGSEGQGQFTEGFTLVWSGLKGAVHTDLGRDTSSVAVRGAGGRVPFQDSRMSQAGLLVPSTG